MKYLLLLTITLLTATAALAGDAILRVNCQPQDAGSKVYINGALKGECPIDIILGAGPVTLEVRKTVDAEHVQYFTEQFTLYPGVAKRVSVTLSEPMLTPAAKKNRELAEAAQKKRDAEAQKKQQLEAFHRDKKAAEGGDIDAMMALTAHYENGTGTPKSPALGAAWRQKATTARERAAVEKELSSAQKGDIAAMEAMARRFADGNGVEKDPAAADEWAQKARQATETKRQQKAESAKQSELAAKRAAIQSKINAIDYMACFGYLTKDVDNNNFFEVLFTGIPGSWLGCASDLILTPSKSVHEKMLTNELNAHASAWAKPDSMVAKAYRLRQADARTVAVQ